ncbi:AraC family transcriptional regulator [Paenibacillus aurantiacus]|uniref:AraC family transcriptional regulator n=1 Tax=Paenibacillus aurantiacus TaxID=1936118 RepID=A0ABV5KVQ3_9BACL
MIIYAKEHYLESEAFPFAVLPFLTLPTRALRPHSHDFIELVYVADGNGEHLYKGRSFPISKGDFFVIPPGIEHDYRVIGDSPLDVYNVMFLPSLLIAELKTLASVNSFIDFFYLEPFLRQNVDFSSHLKLSPVEGYAVKQRIERLHQEFTSKSLGYQISIKALLIEMLVYLSRCYESRFIEPVFHSNESKAIQQLCEFLAQNYEQPISLDHVCRMCGMSQTTFTSKFKQETGRTFTEYRNELRIHASLKPLRETEDNIVAISENVGIHDLSHYHKLFKHYMKMTPRQYRMRCRE